ncbi:hypothetical protein HDU87_002340 [Geranomyces variabilis]|uniref:Uncharacterized protein n=1 Tax=Geranomyces variabilis TaxID=109894 RepID=A0AAD5XIT0_9FUNG|nr:hypothetical protein HDU87_002340 [Geranomyces variabilis]
MRGLSHRELRTLKTFFFRDKTAKSQLYEEIMVNNLEIKRDDRASGERPKTSGGNSAADAELSNENHKLDGLGEVSVVLSVLWVSSRFLTAQDDVSSHDRK